MAFLCTGRIVTRVASLIWWKYETNRKNCSLGHALRIQSREAKKMRWINNNAFYSNFKVTGKQICFMQVFTWHCANWKRRVPLLSVWVPIYIYIFFFFFSSHGNERLITGASKLLVQPGNVLHSQALDGTAFYGNVLRIISFSSVCGLRSLC